MRHCVGADLRMTPTLAMLLPAVLLAQPVAAGRVGPCDGAHSGERWCDASAPVDERVAALVKALTTGEKAGLLSNTAQPVPRLGLPAYGGRVGRYGRVFCHARCIR